MIKVQKGWKNPKSAIAEVHRIYYNFVKQYEVLDGQTPAEKCGIKIEGNDKWMTIIQNAKKEFNKLVKIIVTL